MVQAWEGRRRERDGGPCNGIRSDMRCAGYCTRTPSWYGMVQMWLVGAVVVIWCG